jgi:hypothetical protein
MHRRMDSVNPPVHDHASNVGPQAHERRLLLRKGKKKEKWVTSVILYWYKLGA